MKFRKLRFDFALTSLPFSLLIPKREEGQAPLMRQPENSPGITPIKELFRYDIFGLPADLRKWSEDPSSYSLEITGDAVTERHYTLHDIRRFSPFRKEAVLQCMTRVHWGRVMVKGALLCDVLQDAGLQTGAFKVALWGGEGFSTDLFVQEILNARENFILVYEMNDEPLTPEHGFPLRVAALGKYAYKWCKWLVTVKVLDSDFKGHYEGKRGWSDRAVRGEPVYTADDPP